MKIWCEVCEGTGGIEYDWHNDCVVKTCEVCAGHGYTESDKPTTEINIDYYEELERLAKIGRATEKAFKCGGELEINIGTHGWFYCVGDLIDWAESEGE